MMPRVLGLALCGVAAAVAVAGARQQPLFKSSVELASVDVMVVDDRGQPLTTLAPADFVVRVDGVERKVVSAQWVAQAKEAAAHATTFVPEGYSTNETAAGGRLVIFVVDQPNIRPGRLQSILTAAGGFIDKLSASDRAAAVGLGASAPPAMFLADHEKLKQVLARLPGEKATTSSLGGSFGILPSEAVAIARGDLLALNNVTARECATIGNSAATSSACRTQVEAEAARIAEDAARGSDQTIRGLRGLLSGLRGVAGPKTLILISEGFVADTNGPEVTELGVMAAASRASLYAIQLDSDGDIGDSQSSLRPGDRFGQDSGLEILTAAARGAVFRVNGPAGILFDRIGAELSGYYQLAVESDARDRDGKTHPIRVDVPRRGAIVRTRRQLLTTLATPAVPRRQAVAAGLSAPLLQSALPLRVASFALQGPEPGKIQLLIHADIGTDYSAARAVTVGLTIADASGKSVDTRTVDVRLPPVMNGVPSALQFVTGASLPPGDYTLKLAAAEGDRVGSVEHQVHAALVKGGDVTLSTLMAGGPSSAGDLLTPTVGYTITFGILHAYVEAYGPQVDAVTVAYEIAPSADAPALMKSDASGLVGGDERIIFTEAMLVSQLPPGKYVLRARVSSAAKPVATLTRSFEVAAPAVLMTSAEGVGSTGAEAELFLPIDEATLPVAFRRDDALSADIVGPFRERLSPAAKPDFEAGVTALAAGDFPKAEASLKRAIQPDADSTVPLVYLAATFAATGHDAEAASAWQTALGDGAEFPQVYDWLSQALLRTRSHREASAILEEAVGKWPADPRFTRPLAMLYAIFGKGREAVRTLERYLAARPEDREALKLGVDWIYHAHASGSVIHNRGEDLKLAHAYADAYAAAKGPQVPLVRQWMTFLDNEQR